MARFCPKAPLGNVPRRPGFCVKVVSFPTKCLVKGFALLLAEFVHS